VKIHGFTSPNGMPPRREAAGRPLGRRPPPVLEPSMDHLHPKDRVRLREDYLDLARGAVGVVIGFYRTEEPAVAVKFERGVRKGPFDRLEPLAETG
jgi:hypothetical protein